MIVPSAEARYRAAMSKLPAVSSSCALSCAAIVAVLAILSGCKELAQSSGEATQVAATVNGQEISVSQLQHVVQRQVQGLNDRSNVVAREVLQVLLDQELAAQAARQQGLDHDPRVLQAAEAAKREVLAKAYQDLLAEQAAYPSSDEVDRYYDDHPELFSQRRFFELQEISVSGEHDVLRNVQQSVESAGDAVGARALVEAAGLRSSVRQFTVSPEDVPLLLLARLAELKEGQSLFVPQPGGGRVLTLLSARPARLSRDAARASIHAFLLHDKRGKAVRDGLKALRDTARIEIKADFGQAAAGGTGAVAAPSPQ